LGKGGADCRSATTERPAVWSAWRGKASSARATPRASAKSWSPRRKPSDIEAYLTAVKAFFAGLVVFSPHRPVTRPEGTGRGTMAGTGQGLFVGVAVLGLIALGWAANAEPIPLPTPAPLPKESGAATSNPTAPP